MTLGAEGPLYFSDHVVGCLVITIAVTALAEVTRAVRFFNVPLGLWVAVSPFLLAGATAGLRERARQLRRQALVPLVMLAAAESAELSSSSRRVYRELSHARSGTRVLVG